MIYEVTGYIGTGFDAVNIPDGPALIESLANSAVKFNAVDLVQPFGLTSVRLHAGIHDVEDLDFLKIESEWYTCGVPVMIAEDVAEIPLEHEGILSAGGVTEINQIDGFILRRRVPPLEQRNYAALDDPFLAPAAPQPTQASGILFDDQGSETFTVMVATVDLAELGAAALAGNLLSDTFGEGDAQIAVPHIPKNDGNGKSILSYKPRQDGNTVITVTKPAPGMAYFRGTADSVKAGVVTSRQCGVSESILAQYVLPAVFAGSGTTLRDSVSTDNFGTVAGVMKTETVQFDVPNIAAAQPVLALNKHNVVRLISMATGNTAEYPAYMLNESAGQIGRVYSVLCISDARQEGRPYFRFSWILGRDYTAMGLVPGAQWLNAPLAFYGSKEGSMIASLKKDLADETIRKNAPYENAAAVLSMGSTLLGGALAPASASVDYNTAFSVGEGLSMQALASRGYSGDLAAQQFAADRQASAIMNMASSVGNTVLNVAQQGLQIAQRGMQRAQRRKELTQNLALDYFVAAPSVSFADAEGLRDYVSNGCVVVKSGYSEADLVRLNRVINMFGLFVGREAMKDGSALHANPDYDYIETAGVSVGGSLPKWRREEIEHELNGGIRIWHVKPDRSLYDKIPT